MQNEVKKFWTNLKDTTQKASKEEFDKFKKEFDSKKGEVGKLFKRITDVAHKEKKEIDKMLGNLKKEAVRFIDQQKKITKSASGSGKKAAPKKKATPKKKTAAKKK